MELTAEEKAILAGANGEAQQYALDLLIRFGDIFDAERLLPIRFAHVSCTSLWIEGALIPWLKQLVDMGANVQVPTMSMVTGCDLRNYEVVGQSNDKRCTGIICRITKTNKLRIITGYEDK